MNNTNLINDKKFISIDKSHEIDTTIIDELCYLTIINITLENYKTLLLLIKDIILYLNFKKVKYIKQFITGEDIQFFKKSTINICNNNDNNKSAWITTNIIDFMEEFCYALNINHL
jgi:hypothetical protein